jgi:zinc transporter
MSQDGLVSAYRLPRPSRALEWKDLEQGTGDDPVWVHLERTAPPVSRWLREKSGLDPVVVDALLAEETRPRSASFGDGLVVLLRGVNLNPGAHPEDMVALRVWIDARRLITVRTRRLLAAQDVREEIDAGKGPTTPSATLLRLISHLIGRIGPVVDGLGDEIDDIEESMTGRAPRELRARLAALRRKAIGLRRYLAPQRDVLSRLYVEPSDLFDDRARLALRECADSMLRYVEELDAARERAAVISEELSAAAGERMNRTMYVLSLVSTVFLPLGFVTGLLGVNVAGIPGSEVPFAFQLLTAGLVVLAVVEVLLFRRWRLL